MSIIIPSMLFYLHLIEMIVDPAPMPLSAWRNAQSIWHKATRTSTARTACTLNKLENTSNGRQMAINGKARGYEMKWLVEATR